MVRLDETKAEEGGRPLRRLLGFRWGQLCHSYLNAPRDRRPGNASHGSGDGSIVLPRCCKPGRRTSK